MLEVINLKKTYPKNKNTETEFTINLNLNVSEGETLVLVGPSGSGKTSALNLITGLAEPDSGKVIVNGIDITNTPTHKRNISVVFQDLALFPHLDAGENITYGLFIQGIPKKERRIIAEEMLNLVRLPGYASRRIDTLSGGERQRIAIARALASNPRALLLDEPFSSLDAPLRNTLRREFLEIRSKSTAACIFITHDREEAMMLGDRIALMDKGRIIETGTGRELFLEPKTETASRFFGAGQVLPCKILEAHSYLTLISSALGEFSIPQKAESFSPLLFIPHDAISLAEESKPEQKNFSAICTGSFFGGQNLILALKLPGDDAFTFEIIVNARTKIPVIGSPVNLQIDQTKLRLVLPENN